MKKRLINWNAEYATGQWEGCGDKDQRARYALLAGMICVTGAKTVLDVGCGRGLLREFIPSGTLSSYTGLDISQAAIDGISDRQAHESFVCCNVEDWQTAQCYEAIVLNEVLYYFGDPLGALARIRYWLRPGGILIVSIFRHPSWRSPNHKVLNLARRVFAADNYELVEDVEITAKVRGTSTWSVLCARVVDPAFVHGIAGGGRAHVSSNRVRSS